MNKDWRLLLVMVHNSVSPLPEACLNFGPEIGHAGTMFLHLFMNDIHVSSVARHASERYSSSKILILLAILLQAVGIDFGVARMLNYFLFKLPNSRTQELEGKSGISHGQSNSSG